MQGFGIVIPCDPIGADETAALATVQEGDLFSVADLGADGIHNAFTEAPPVPHRDVYVKAAKTARTVITLSSSW